MLCRSIGFHFTIKGKANDERVRGSAECMGRRTPRLTLDSRWRLIAVDDPRLVGVAVGTLVVLNGLLPDESKLAHVVERDRREHNAPQHPRWPATPVFDPLSDRL